MSSPVRVAVLSLEPWDDVWRRNQHFAARLVRDPAVRDLLFVTPPRGGLAWRAQRHRPLPGVEVVTPPLLVPRRFGGYRVLGAWLRRATRSADVLWINDPVAGVAALRPGVRAVYDVTDDWRSMPQADADARRTVTAEDILARRATTVVCSDELALRWQQRYAVQPTVVRNGVDVSAIRGAQPIELAGRAPHAVYVGTLHANRFDVALTAALAQAWPGTVHLVGPIGLSEIHRTLLTDAGARLVGAVPARDVPRWLVAADVLICPHVVDDFTLSLDAIKSHEYLATDLPVVATPSSGFQSLSAPGLTVVDRDRFVDAALVAAGAGPVRRDVAVDWDERAAQFRDVLLPDGDAR
ncbi:glycosyltransferase [uncultured Jatrophihabitans sp.]|uniref:glycosyltransferase n=1 Tax=uncultured Jatrophihabitans sp. TaxID=1610747 RepID=UPI0035C94686